jgi:hypothetical protein
MSLNNLQIYSINPCHISCRIDVGDCVSDFEVITFHGNPAVFKLGVRSFWVSLNVSKGLPKSTRIFVVAAYNILEVGNFEKQFKGLQFKKFWEALQ